MDIRQRVYDILRGNLSSPEPKNSVRVGVLSYHETEAYDAIVALIVETLAALPLCAQHRSPQAICEACRREFAEGRVRELEADVAARREQRIRAQGRFERSHAGWLARVIELEAERDAARLRCQTLEEGLRDVRSLIAGTTPLGDHGARRLHRACARIDALLAPPVAAKGETE